MDNNMHTINYSSEYTRNYEERFVAEISHTGLKKYRTIKDLTEHILETKIEQQFETWDTQYRRKLDSISKDKNKETAQESTEEAQKIQEGLQNILIHTLDIDDAVSWESLKSNASYVQAKPEKPKTLKTLEIPPEPEERFYQPNLSFIEKSVKILSKNKVRKAKARFDAAFEAWKKDKLRIEKENELKTKEYKNSEKDNDKQVKIWESEKQSFYDKQNKNNEDVNLLKQEYEQKKPNAIVQYCEMVLNNSDYSLFEFSKDFELEFNPVNKTLIVEYLLPSMEQIPTLTEIKFISTRNEIKEVHLSNTKVAQAYDSIVYQMTLRSIHELFEADVINALDAIVFNGWVDSLNKATGQSAISCIVSVHTSKNEFLGIDLSLVEPKTCFKGLKGVGSSKLSSLIPINPLMKIDRNDKRFIHSKDVADSIDEGDNLAAMDWQDFEHLVRELFHKEYSSNGGEVKVTQSSRDGGVDAIAFDPHPIRGGKIVIQAKRYTNTVGVNAVRDLYGTTMNEGAMKGILVTTSNYGPDAYNFSKGKPLTLIDGGGLLFLLEKHGHKAKIDLAEAKRINKEL